MSRIVLISNRVSSAETAQQAGGLAVALTDLMTDHDALWFGWNGEILDPSADVAGVNSQASPLGEFATTSLSESEYRDFYLGYSNSVLWPVFHSRLDLAQFDAGYFPEYLRVSKRFAGEISKLLRADDIIWVHDYHLIPIASELRALGVENPIGFFLHIPVPPSQTLLAVPEHMAIAEGFAAYDLVGVQSQLDIANLIDFFRQSNTGELVADGRLRVGDRLLTIGSFPVGIDLENYYPDESELALSSDAEFRIIGIDRLDYTKGLPQKFRAFGKFLDQYPQYCGRVVLTQVAPPTREQLDAYTGIRQELESLAGAINGRYGELDWVPIYYIHRSICRTQLHQIYRSCSVGLVTPLRDGMNLVAKEYVAAQDPVNPGVLILSRFAGAAEQMNDALIVNPYNSDEVALAIRTALEMPLEERRQRHLQLMDVIAGHGSREWANMFLTSLISNAAEQRLLRTSFEASSISTLLNSWTRSIEKELLSSTTRRVQ